MFKAKELSIEANHNMYVMLLEKDAEALGLGTGDRVKVFPSNNKENFLVCELEILECTEFVCDVRIKPGELGIFRSAFHKIGLRKNANVSILPAPKPKSLEAVKLKFKGEKRLSSGDFKEIIKDIVENNYSSVETAYFVLACTAHPLDDDEVIGLTKAMVNVGQQLDFRSHKDDIIVDKHCIGGVPGNRTTMLVIPIVASAGLIIPKTSSRSITSPSGTADTMEVLAKVDLSLNDMHEVVRRTNACIAWGGSLDLSPADDLIINIEHPLEIDSEGQMIASILSKKKSVGSTHVLIDIPVGPTAKVTTTTHAERLKRRFEKVGRAIGMDLKVVITDGSQPIGYGVGPSLEAEDVMKVLKNDKDCSKPLKDKAVRMAGYILEMGGVAKKGLGESLALKILESGMALRKFEDIIEEQGKNGGPKRGKFHHEVRAQKDGKITQIDNKRVSKMAFIMGCPRDTGAGLIISKSLGEKVKKGDLICTLYSNSALKLKYGILYCEENHPFKVK